MYGVWRDANEEKSNLGTESPKHFGSDRFDGFDGLYVRIFTSFEVFFFIASYTLYYTKNERERIFIPNKWQISVKIIKY